MQLQRAASEIWGSIALIPGLLQTKEYARTRIQLAQPTASVEEIDQKVRARLTVSPPDLSSSPAAGGRP